MGRGLEDVQTVENAVGLYTQIKSLSKLNVKVPGLSQQDEAKHELKFCFANQIRPNLS